VIYDICKVLLPRDLGLVGPLTMTLLQIYCLVYFERILSYCESLVFYCGSLWFCVRLARTLSQSGKRKRPVCGNIWISRGPGYNRGSIKTLLISHFITGRRRVRWGASPRIPVRRRLCARSM